MFISYIYFILCTILIALLLIFPGIAHLGTDLGVELFMEALFPYLLPYLILTQWFIRLTESRKGNFSKWRLYLKVYGISALGGFPTGAATVSYLKKTNQISGREAVGLISICHSPSPLFVIGYVGQDLLKNTTFSWNFLFLYHIVSFFLLFLFYFFEGRREETFHVPPLGNLKESEGNHFTASIKDSVPTVLIVGATIIFFSTIYTVIMHFFTTFAPKFHQQFGIFLAASLEMTNGLLIAEKTFSNNVTILLLFCSLFLTIQSISIHMQVAVIAKSENISLKNYFRTRLLLAFIIPSLYYLLFI